MKTRLRVLVLACASIGALTVASSAMAAFVPSIGVRHATPTLNASSAQVIRVVVPRDHDPLFRAVIYVPTGYTATLNQAAGTQIGTVGAQVQVREPIAGAVLPLEGTIRTDNPATHAANQCAPGPHAAVWVLTLTASGQTLTVPVYVDPTTGTEAAIGAYKLTVCLPSPNIPQSQGGATFGAKLILAQLNLQSGVITTPANRGEFRWHMLATPWPATAGPPNAAGTVSAIARADLPARINNLRVTSARGRVTVRGGVVEGSRGVASRRVTVRIGNRTFFAQTNTGGAFRLTVARKRGTRITVTVTAAIPERPASCSVPSPFPGVNCVSETLQSFTVTATTRHRVR